MVKGISSCRRLIALMCACSSISSGQTLRPIPLEASELAPLLQIYIQKYTVDFPEPVFATIILRQDDRVSSFETSKPAQSFDLRFQALPSELMVSNPKSISFHASVNGG